MKTVRFSQVVAKCGHPETHLLLTDPKKDRALQAAVKAKRVLTVMQSSSKTKTDWGEEGFHPGASRQYLVFPKSLAAYAGKAFVGIKYDLLSDAETPRRRSTPSAPKPAKKAPVRDKPRKAAPPLPKAEPDTAPSKPPPSIQKKEAPEIASMKRQVRRAMQALEKGRQVAAFNLLQKIVVD